MSDEKITKHVIDYMMFGDGLAPGVEFRGLASRFGVSSQDLIDSDDEIDDLRELAELVGEWQEARKASILSTTVDAKGNLIHYPDIIDRLAEAEHRLNAWGKE